MHGGHWEVVVSHKEIALSFLRMAAAGNAHEAFERCASPSFEHHEVHVPGDAASLANAMDEDARVLR